MSESEVHEEARDKRERALNSLLRGGERVRKGRQRDRDYEDE